MKNYFTAFKYKDKESSKLIQAAGYTYSFYEFLRKIGIVNDTTSLVLNAVGYSDRGLSAISVRPENLAVLKTCYEIYKDDLSGKDISDNRKQVLNRIKRSAYGSFSNGKDFVERLLAIQPDSTSIITHQEQIKDFFNSVGQVPQELMNHLGLTGTMNLREAHAELIKKALNSEATYLFLTGNPGIGKTTAIANFLREHIDEGFLFFYVSPRTQVNLDIIEKFKDKDSQQLCDRRILAINTHSNLITDNFGTYTVQYLWNQRQGDFSKQSVNFRDSRSLELRGRRSNKLTKLTEDTIQDSGRKSRGVLNSICEAVSTIVNLELSNNIVATVAIQSLKKTYTRDTLKHFEKIFRNAYNERDGVILLEGMQKISRRIKHLFIMIDEITGDDGGVEFLHGISQIISKYQLMLPENGFNTKVIVADASIVDENVISQHLSDKSPEPDKIYFRKATDTCEPLSQKQFQFKDLLATVINANSYPASSLSITYKVVIESCQYSEQIRLERKRSVIKSLQKEIFQDIEALLKRSDVEQIIVYIQNKQRLAELIETIKNYKGNFQLFQDYLEIHANISEQEKEEINRYKNDVKVVFMTASGSRGLSFPKAKHILIEIPGFQIEKNLMEIIQVIYRGRGDDIIDNQDKELIFYLGESSVYYQDDEVNQKLSIQESVLGLLNILLILKAAIMTRIVGYGLIGKNKFIIIPIGGKSIFAVGETFSTQIASLIYQLKQEYYRNRSDKVVENVFTNLEELLGKAEFIVRDSTESNYLHLQKSFNHKFTQICQSLDNLLDFGNIELGYISGSLLIVPFKERSLEETYYMRVLDIANYANEDLWRNMQKISYSKSYPESLRSAIKDAIELVKKLRDGVDKTQKLEQSSQNSDQYYALPLFAFVSGEVMKDYFASNPQEPEDETFRNILTTYIRSLYPVGNILPIGDKYR
ncbi:MAG: ATP-binding protein, partial [Scytonema sp. PMC 1069.18]|nr:ATP-binding protein [Scytonema sp. PMC 1069.18]